MKHGGDAVEAIRAFNAGREPERLAMKYARMRHDAYAFFRGSCHLFHARLGGARWFAKAPLAWSVGDAHLENVGSYKADNGLVHFDWVDFDEAALAPLTLDVLRVATSLLVAADSLNADAAQARRLARSFVEAHAAALARGEMRWIERETARGLVGDLLEGLRQRRRRDLIARRTVVEKGRRTLRCDGTRALPATEAEHDEVRQRIATATADLPDPGRYEVLDVARRIAGTGSLGLERFVVLVAGSGAPDGHRLLDLKRAVPSSVRSEALQPRWRSEAERVVAVQRRMQAVPAALLRAVGGRRRSYVLRELQPSEDRLSLDASAHGLEAIEAAVGDIARLLAWAQLRSAGRQGSADADALIAFGTRVRDWRGDLLERADRAAKRNHEDWRAFCVAVDRDPLLG